MTPPPVEQEFGSVECLEIIRTMRHGAMQPLLCRADDGAQYVVKPFSSGGNWAQIMEWVCARLGRKIGLPIPNYRIVLIEESLAEAWNASSSRRVESGFGFGSQMIENAVECTETLLQNLTTEMAQRVTAFDWWVRNRDRTVKNTNLLWNAGSRQIFAIDHDQAGGSADGTDLFWSLHLGTKQVSPDAVWLPAQLKSEFQQALAECDTILAELPSAWTSCGEDVASYFAQLKHTLNDTPHKEWRIYD